MSEERTIIAVYYGKIQKWVDCSNLSWEIAAADQQITAVRFADGEEKQTRE